VSWLVPIVLVIVNAAWLVLVLLGLPGTWMMVATTLLVAWWHWPPTGSNTPPMFSLGVLLAIVVVAVVAEVLELAAGMVGAKATGGTRRGAAGALGGGLIGAVAGTFLIPIPLLGSLLGACLGAALGAWGLELSGGREHGAALKAGMGAGVGRLLGMVMKLLAGVAIWVVVAVAAFWP
jgi:uncharacterized protein YqgC (DUF456 family)